MIKKEIATTISFFVFIMIINYFDAYTNAGFQPIALNLYTKKPVEPNWNKDWSVLRWRKYFECDSYNIGILLGKIIDVEADCEKSNHLLDSLIGDHKHVKFTSFRSTHHLFINEDKNFKFLKVHGIEFRGHGLHSVVPPSMHQNGKQYKFTIDSSFKLSRMPEKLNKLFHDNLSRKSNENGYYLRRKKVFRHNCKTICKKCGQEKFINKKRLACEVKIFADMQSPWLCHKCRKFSITKMVRKMLN